MTTEEFQKLVLRELQELNSKMDRIDNRADNQDKRMDRLEKTVNTIYNQTAELIGFKEETKSQFDNLIKELREVKISVSRIEVNTAENWREIAILKSVK